jgi:hypothetical protein
MKPVIGQLDGAYTATHDLEFYGLTFDLNAANLTHVTETDPVSGYPIKWGKGFYNVIHIRGGLSEENFAYNISIHDCTFEHGMGDSARMFQVKDFTYYNNFAADMQHTAVFGSQVLGADVYNNTVEHITNAGIRFDHSEDVYIHNNLIYDFTGDTVAYMYGSEGIQIGNSPNYPRLTNNIYIYDNDIQGSLNAIQLMDALGTAGTTPQNVYIYHNTIHNSGWSTTDASYNGGIVDWKFGNGLHIYENNITDSYGSALLAWSGYSTYAGSVIDFYDNNIDGVRLETYNTIASNGYGVANYVGTSYISINATNNYITGCTNGNYYGVTPVSTASSPIDLLLT